MVKVLCPQPKEPLIKKDRTTPLNQGYPPKRIKSTPYNISSGYINAYQQKNVLTNRATSFLKMSSVLMKQIPCAISRLLELAQKDIKAGRDYSHLKNARRVWNLIKKHEVFEQAIQHTRIIEAQQYLLGKDLVLSSFTTNIIGICASASNLHIDFPLGTQPTPRPSFALSANSVWFPHRIMVKFATCRNEYGYAACLMCRCPTRNGSHPVKFQ